MALLAAVASCSGQRAANPQSANSSGNLVELNATQLRTVAIVPAAERTFTVDDAAVGVIDFDEDRTVQVSTPYQGRVVQLRRAPVIAYVADSCYSASTAPIWYRRNRR